MHSRNFSVATETARRALCLMLVAVLMTSTFFLPESWSPVSSVGATEKVDDLKAQRQELLDKQAELEAQRNEVASTLEEYEAIKQQRQAEIDVVLQKIDVNEKIIAQFDTKISEKAHQIASKQQDIARKEEEISARFEELRLRLRAISKTGTLNSLLQMIINSQSYADYLIKSKAVECVSAENRRLMDQLEGELQGINDAKAALEEEKAQYEEELKPYVEMQNELEYDKQHLEVLYSEVNAITEQLNTDIDHFNAEIRQHEQDAADLQREINKAIAQQYNSAIYNQSGTMLWPAPTCNYISSTFKWRWGRQHSGIDICGSGCYGAPIVAASDGVVSLAGWCGGYGYCVMIDHGTNSNGKNVTTVYGHAARQPSVSVGQRVSAGDQIAVIGSTGNSTGPHLHFEVRVGGSAVNPIANGYISTSGIIVNESL